MGDVVYLLSTIPVKDQDFNSRNSRIFKDWKRLFGQRVSQDLKNNTFNNFFTLRKFYRKNILKFSAALVREFDCKETYFLSFPLKKKKELNEIIKFCIDLNLLERHYDDESMSIIPLPLTELANFNSNAQYARCQFKN